MIPQICKNCHWWVQDYYNECARFGFTDDRHEAPPADELLVLVSVSDDYGLRVGMKTGPDFGCVKFEPQKS